MSDIAELVAEATRVKETLSPDETFEMYESHRISASKPVPTPVAILKIHDIPICTPGSLMAVSSQSKGGKGGFVAVPIAGSVCTSNGYDGSEFIEVATNEDCKAVIHIDTEQSKFHHFRNFWSGILKRARLEMEPDYLYSYNTTGLTLCELRTFTTRIFEAASKKSGGIFLAVIDGIADYMNSVNDEEEANAAVSFFQHLAIKYNTAIILVVHLNPGSDKERGHLGSQLQRKCESVLTIKKENDVSILEAKLLRSGGSNEFLPIRYQFDKSKGYHTFFDACDTGPKASRNLLELAQFVFAERVSAGDAVNLIMESESIAERKAKSILTEIYDAGLVEKTVQGRNVFYSLKNQDDTPF